MKNRLQFNRFRQVFGSREEAKNALNAKLESTEFIPLIGEPIVLRYKDAKENKQVILAVGKATGETGVEYHIVDTADIYEKIDFVSGQTDFLSAGTIAGLEFLSGQTSGLSATTAEFSGTTKLLIDKLFDDLGELSGATSAIDETIAFVVGEGEHSAVLRGAENIASGPWAVAEGHFTSAITENAHAEGYKTLASGTNAHAEGFSTYAAGQYSHAEGTRTSASTQNAHAEGYQTIASGINSHAENRGTIALGDSSHAEGKNTIANNEAEHAEGVFNVSHSETGDGKQTISSIGVGINKNARKNAFEVMYNGDTYLLDVGGYDGSSLTGKTIQKTIKDLEDRNIVGESAITVTGEGIKTVSLKIKDGDKVLSQDVNGLSSEISLVYDSESTTIYLYGKNGAEISSIDARDFIKDGMLSSATIYTATTEDMPPLVPGEVYLKLIFNDEAQYGPVYIPVKSLCDVYTVSATSLPYLTIENYEIRANVDTNDGLASKEFADSVSRGVVYVSGITTNIIAAAGLSQGTPGTYPPHPAGLHYITGATSLNNADEILDNSLFELSSSIDDKITEAVEGVVPEITEDIMEQVGQIVSGVSGDIVTYVDEQVSGLVDSAETLNGLVSGLINSAETLDGRIDGLTESADTLYEKLVDDELVISAALNDLNDRVENIENDYVTTNVLSETIAPINANVTTINEKIPAAATSENMLADKNWVSEKLSNELSDYYTMQEVNDLIEDSSVFEKGLGTNSAQQKGTEASAISAYSVAEGANTAASGISSHAEGSATTAHDAASHAEGYSTYAKGQASHAEGKNTKTNNGAEHAEGQYNVSHAGTNSWEKTISSVGIGQNGSNRSNALEIMLNGDAYLFGVGGYTGDIITGNIKTLQEALNEKPSKEDVSEIVPKAQETTTIVIDALTNLNGRVLTNYGAAASSVTIGDNTYKVIIITYSGEILTRERAENYMEYMTGSRFLPEYDYEKPKNSIIAFADGTLWKPQYSEIETGGAYDGLYLFKLPVEIVWERGTGANSIQQKGTNASASGSCSVAEGSGTIARGANSHAEGYNSYTWGGASHAEGDSTRCAGDAAHTEGKSTYAVSSAVYAHAEGEKTYVFGTGAHSEGISKQSYIGDFINGNTGDTKDVVFGKYSVSPQTKFNLAFSGASHSEGRDTLALGDAAHSEGYQSVAYGDASHAEGAGSSFVCTITAKTSDTVFDVDSDKLNVGDLLIYYHISADTFATYYSRVLQVTGNQIVTASFDVTLNEGDEISVVRGVAFAKNSHVEGENSLAYGDGSHAEGRTTIASGECSHVEGHLSIANGRYSHAGGLQTVANGAASYSNGQYTVANGVGSHAEGYGTASIGDYSHSEGYMVAAKNRGEHSQGNYNYSHSPEHGYVYGESGNTTFSVGIGTENKMEARKNAFEIMENGDTYVFGIGNYDGQNLKGPAIQTLQEVISGVTNFATEAEIRALFDGGQGGGSGSGE